MEYVALLLACGFQLLPVDYTASLCIHALCVLWFRCLERCAVSVLLFLFGCWCPQICCFVVYVVYVCIYL